LQVRAGHLTITAFDSQLRTRATMTLKVHCWRCARVRWPTHVTIFVPAENGTDAGVQTILTGPEQLSVAVTVNSPGADWCRKRSPMSAGTDDSGVAVIMNRRGEQS